MGTHASLDRVRNVQRVTLLSAAVALAAVLAVAPTHTRADANTGEQKFNAICAVCHTIGAGRKVGPDLRGVTERRSEAWLLRFIKSSQTVINSGDPDATALFREFNIPMPDAPYSEAEIREILAFISGGAASAASPAAGAAPAAERPTTPADIARGRDMFQGRIRFANRGPACNSCHHVRNDAVIGGGVLAKDLTQVFSRMGGAGVTAILGQPPFPVMEAAYKSHPLLPEESRALVAFLEDADAKHAFQQPVDYGMNLVLAGSAVFLVLAAIYAVLWRRRKRFPVNHAIFERQIRSE